MTDERENRPILSADFLGEIRTKFYCWIYRRQNRPIISGDFIGPVSYTNRPILSFVCNRLKPPRTADAWPRYAQACLSRSVWK